MLGLGDNTLTSILIKQLYLDDTNPTLTETVVSELADIETLTVGAEATVIIKLTFEDKIEIKHNQTEVKYYADSYKQNINANQNIEFNINDVQVNEYGEAVIRLGLGREHGKTLIPEISINGQPMTVSEDYRGYDQYFDGAGRLQFFGVIEIPVANEFIKSNNHVVVSFTDDGGFVTSLAMQYFAHTKQLARNSQ
ncbi:MULTISPECIES: hypothetical protein [unclassified Shewanella]|uniref:hypothetical protein n=1 Tax=unclassified Shewanella TaxID=196818 RepID=UPI00354E2AF6